MEGWMFEPVMIGINVIYLGHGLIYAMQIQHTPTEHGWTWSSVGTGVGSIFIACFLNVVLLFLFNQVSLLNLFIALFFGFATYGLPMAVSQIFKKVAADRAVNKIKRNRDFNAK